MEAALIFAAAVASLTVPVAHAWQQWEFDTTAGVGPQPRKGHTLVMVGPDKLVMFGGRSVDTQKQHVPKTYKTVSLCAPEISGETRTAAPEAHATAIALVDYTAPANEPGRLSFRAGDIISIVDERVRPHDPSIGHKSALLGENSQIPWPRFSNRTGSLVWEEVNTRGEWSTQRVQEYKKWFFGGSGLIAKDPFHVKAARFFAIDDQWWTWRTGTWQGCVYNATTGVCAKGMFEAKQVEEEEILARSEDGDCMGGRVDFQTYDQFTVCEKSSDTPAELEECIQQQWIMTGVYFNDVWEYDMSCERYADHQCTHDTWFTLHPGAVRGGCKICQKGRDRNCVPGEAVCPVPYERWGHAAAVFADPESMDGLGRGDMYIYGGFSQACSDYCSDLWVYWLANASNPVTYRKWDKLQAHADYAPGLKVFGPGGRWKIANVFDLNSWIMFGGHRMWHGFAWQNTDENAWGLHTGNDETMKYHKGGFMDDLWIYDFGSGNWTELTRKQECLHSPGRSWGERYDIKCWIDWPEGRSGAAAALVGSTIYVHGGYRTFFPYPHLDSYGAGPGTTPRQGAGFSAFPTMPFYMNDLWRYNRTTGIWKELKPVSEANPAGRYEHTLSPASSNLLIMVGGYRSNYHHAGMWYYNIAQNRWLLKTKYVHPLYGPDCVSDYVGDDLGSFAGFSETAAPYLPKDRTAEHAFDDAGEMEPSKWEGGRWKSSVVANITRLRELERNPTPLRSRLSAKTKLWLQKELTFRNIPHPSGRPGCRVKTSAACRQEFLKVYLQDELQFIGCPKRMVCDHADMLPDECCHEPGTQRWIEAFPQDETSLIPGILYYEIEWGSCTTPADCPSNEFDCYDNKCFKHPWLPLRERCRGGLRDGKLCLKPEDLNANTPSRCPGGGTCERWGSCSSYEKKVSKGYAPNTPVNARRFDPDLITDASTRHRGIALECPPNRVDVALDSTCPPGMALAECNNLLLDRLYSAKMGYVLIMQPRRRAEGWNGCRRRIDGRDETWPLQLPRDTLPMALQWKQPEQRSAHAAAFAPKHNSLVLFGGHGYPTGTCTHFQDQLYTWKDGDDLKTLRFQDYGITGKRAGLPCFNWDVACRREACEFAMSKPGSSVKWFVNGEISVPTNNGTNNSVTFGDFWVYNLNDCVHNCSGHGFCDEGYCICNDGYYGNDCSNMTCPGSFCWYDPNTRAQNCRHCCSANYETAITVIETAKERAAAQGDKVAMSSDDEALDFEKQRYLHDQRKVSCNHENPGEIHGMCDGFGHCQCQPPFVTSDCSVQDCPRNGGGLSCSGHGTCMLEFPVGRCQCEPLYYGSACGYKRCLNNCTYPNGECNPNTGRCRCSMWYNPYNNTDRWRNFSHLVDEVCVEWADRPDIDEKSYFTDIQFGNMFRKDTKKTLARLEVNRYCGAVAGTAEGGGSEKACRGNPVISNAACNGCLRVKKDGELKFADGDIELYNGPEGDPIVVSWEKAGIIAADEGRCVRFEPKLRRCIEQIEKTEMLDYDPTSTGSPLCRQGWIDQRFCCLRREPHYYSDCTFVVPFAAASRLGVAAVARWLMLGVAVALAGALPLLTWHGT